MNYQEELEELVKNSAGKLLTEELAGKLIDGIRDAGAYWHDADSRAYSAEQELKNIKSTLQNIINNGAKNELV